AASTPATGTGRVTAAAGQPVSLRCQGKPVVVSFAAGALARESMLRCEPVEPGTVPRPPTPPVGEILFRLQVEGDAGPLLPGLAGLSVEYPAGAVPPGEPRQLVLGYLDGARWVPVESQVAEPAVNRVTATVDRAGVYALYQRP
ncbi:MAG: hypothetical protein M3O34_09860, partial [Chloroflexota bacterium]|nr:hypothetical protein [Chloroflexota bacterium]